MPRAYPSVVKRTRPGYIQFENMDEFQDIVTRWVQSVEGDFKVLVRKVALQLFTMIVKASPVDTGRFRSNWDMEVNAWPSRPPRPEGVGPSGNAGNQRRAVQIAMKVAMAKVAEIQEMDKWPAFVGISNNLPYARRLEYEPGFTKKAEAGFTRAQVAVMREKLKGRIAMEGMVDDIMGML